METNKQLRLNRIFGADQRAVVGAIDHGIAGLSPLGALTNPSSLIPAVIAGGADALIVTPGVLKTCGSLMRGAGVILRIDGGPSAL